MPEGEPRRVPPEKTSAPIVRSGRVRRSGGRRQATIAVFVIVIIGGVMAAGYFLFLPRDAPQTVGDYTVASVMVETLLDTVELSGTVTARSTATVSAPESGFMDRLFAAEGDWVNAGALVARVDARALADELESLELSLDKSLRELDRFVLQHEYGLRALSRQRSTLEDALADAEDDLAETSELFEIGSATRTQVEDAEDALAAARDALDDHEATLEETIALHELTLANNEDDISAMRLEIADLEERIADTAITAPISGRVVAIADSATIDGELLQQYETILQIADTRDPLVESVIEEQYVGLISTGQPVAVEVGGTRYEGSIERIGQIASTTSDGGTPTVEIDIAIAANEQGTEILPGTSAIVEVLIGRIDDALVLPRGPYLTSGNRRYLFRVDGLTAHRIEVEYGAVTDERVQIVSGVTAGDRIITSSYQSYVDQRTVRLEEEE